MYTKTTVIFKPRQIDRSPRLETILMIESLLYTYKSDKTVTQIWKLLPKKVMWTTFTTVLRYLEHSGKIYVEKDKTITWLWDPNGVEKFKKSKLVIK
jgi:ribosomal protein L24E